MSVVKHNTYFKENDGKIYYYDAEGIKKEVPSSAFGDIDDKIRIKLDTSAFENVSGTFYTTDNPSGFIDKSVNDLTNYYTTSQTYSQTEIDEKLADFGGFEVVSLTTGENPVPDVNVPSTKIIYLTKDSESLAKDPYTEWIYTSADVSTTAWEVIGETTVDLSNYYTTAQTSGSEQLTVEFAKYVQTANTGTWDVTNYSGKDCVYVSNHEIGLSANYKTAVESVSGKLDVSIYETNSATFYTKDNPSGFITGVDLTPYQPISAMSDYYTKSETSGKQEIQDALALKEDKVFIAEYNVTPYADIKAAYDAGKQIVCKYNYGNEFIYAQLEQYITYSVQPFIFNNARPGQDWSFTCINNNGVNEWSQQTTHYYDTTATSGSQQLADAFNAKQDTLTAGTNLVINNGIIKVNTDGSANGVYTFVEGSATIATADYAHAEGWNTSAYGKESHAEGACTLASGNFGAHSEGADTSAIGDNSHAEGYLSISIGEDSHAEGWGSKSEGEDSHAEGSYTSAVGWVSHAEGEFTSAIGDASHTEGTNTIAYDEDMHAGGKYNKTTANAAFVIGNGTDNSARSDAFIVDWNGTVSSTKLATSGIADIEAALYSINAVPDSTSADNGKVLTVNSNGTPVWVSGGGGSNIQFSASYDSATETFSIDFSNGGN